MSQEIIQYLSQFVTPERFKLFKRNLEDRTRYLTVVLEDIYQPHNTSAVLRSCECFGIQNVHIIENKNKFALNHEIALGASQWINLIKYNNSNNPSLDAINLLKKQGYRIVATTPHTNDVNLETLDLAKGKIALFFGTELTGLTNTVIENADEFVKIPMFGFTESLNISVCVAITLHYLTLKMHNSNLTWKLSEEEKGVLMHDWLKTSIYRSDLIEKRFLEEAKK
jgi:tRNA (guanosine-2'-O-)-methyltransferase